MDLTTLRSTTAGKAIVGAAVAAAGLGGLSAAGAVELPTQASDADPVVVEETPADPADIVAQTPAAEHADPRGEDEATTEEATTAEATTSEDDTQTSEFDGITSRSDDDGDLPGVEGQSVAEAAQEEGGVDGHEVSEAARAGTPAEEQVTDERGTEAEQTADTEDDEDPGAPEDAGSQADEHRPEQADAGGDNRP